MNEPRRSWQIEDRDTQAIMRAMTISAVPALLWIAVSALTAPNLARSPWPSSGSTGMGLDAPGYVLVVIPLVYLGVWRLSVTDGEQAPHQHTLAIVGSLAILWFVVSAVASYA